MNSKDYYTERNFNCSESIIHYFNEKYNLDLSESDMTLLSGFGGGMGCGEVCGALCGCIAVISRLSVKTKAHETDGFGQLCSDFVSCFKKELGGINCRDVKPLNFKEGVRCGLTVEKAEKLLSDCLRNTDRNN